MNYCNQVGLKTSCFGARAGLVDEFRGKPLRVDAYMDLYERSARVRLGFRCSGLRASVRTTVSSSKICMLTVALRSHFGC